MAELEELSDIDRQKIAYRLLGNIDRWQEIDSITGEFNEKGDSDG